MPFKLSFPDLARRLARGLGVVGKTPVQLDETAIQTILVRDLTLPEFSRVPTTWSATILSTAAVGFFPVTGIRCESGVIVVQTGISFSRTFLGMQYRLARQVDLGIFTSRQLIVLNRPDDEQQVTPGSQINAQIAVPPGFIFQEAEPRPIQSSTEMILQKEVVLFPNDNLVALPIVSGANFIRSTFTGKQYPPLAR